ncbi:hypothetical protein AOA89_21485 [Salmonella enterica]|nr:hypothetical protein [Salmonella enterica]
MKKINWTREMDDILGTDFDSVIAGKLNITQQLVVNRRKELGIPGYAFKENSWKPEEDAILGTDSLANIAKVLNRPTSQIQKRMKELGIAHFDQRGTPRNSVRLHAEQAQKERNKVRFIHRMRKGAVIAEGVANGYTYTAIAKDLGISPTAVRNQFFMFLRVAMLPSMLGEEIPRDLKIISPHVLKKEVRCVEDYCLSLEKTEVE